MTICWGTGWKKEQDIDNFTRRQALEVSSLNKCLKKKCWSKDEEVMNEDIRSEE